MIYQQDQQKEQLLQSHHKFKFILKVMNHKIKIVLIKAVKVRFQEFHPKIQQFKTILFSKVTRLRY